MQKTGYPHIDKPWMQFYDEKKTNEKEPNVNLTKYLKDKTKGNNSLIESEYYGKKKTYKDFWNNVDNASKAFTGLGVKQNDRIMYMVPNIPSSGELWLGATQIGAVSDFIDPRPDTMDQNANAQKVLELIKHEKANHIVALDQCYLGMLKPIEQELKELGIDRIVTLSASNEMNIIQKINYLMDVIAYSKLKSDREEETKNALRELKHYQSLLNKIQSMKHTKEAYKEAVLSSPLEVVTYEDVLKNTRNSNFTEVKTGELLNYIGHTSGTSGSRPKPITLTSNNQISSTEQLFKANANFQKGDRVLHVLPFFSPLGADNNYILNIASNSTNIDIPEFEINEFGYLIKKYHPNVVLATPSWLAALPSCKYLDNEDLSCITRIIYGGDSMTKDDEEKLNTWLKNHHCNAVVEKGHGMSELCGCGSYAQKEWNKYESIGIPLPNTIYGIVDPSVEDKLVPLKFEEGQDTLKGELVISSDAVTEGKLDDEVVVPHYEMDGKSYIRTRDLVEMERNGIFHFDSRKDRSFTRFDGYKVKPYEIEREIEKSPLVKYCRIVPYFDEEQRGLMPKAHIILENQEDDDLYEITSEIITNQIINNKDMSSRQIPSKIKYREKLPLTANSKVNFNALIKEGLDNTEVSVKVRETNLQVGEIEIIVPSKETKRILK